ncbi:MAG: sugar phosphate isomerase/epimerase [Pseudomonadota bacterium]
MTHILSLAAGTLPEFAPPAVAEAAGIAGFSHVGFTIEPDQWNTAMLRSTKQALRDHNLSVLDVEVIWIPEGGAVDDSHKLIIEAGAELSAPNVLVVSAEPDQDCTAAALHQLCEWAAPAGMQVSLEFLMITAVQSLDTAISIVEKADHEAAGVLIDTLHFCRAGHQPADLTAKDPGLFAYTQICDGNAECAPGFETWLEDAIDLRSVPGEGELPVHNIMTALPDNIPLSLEIRSRRWRDAFPDAADRAKAIHAKTQQFFAAENISFR